MGRLSEPTRRTQGIEIKCEYNEAIGTITQRELEWKSMKTFQKLIYEIIMFINLATLCLEILLHGMGLKCNFYRLDGIVLHGSLYPEKSPVV
jgi:hypothetical protein